LKQSPLSNSKNLCSWELSPVGAQEFNQLYNEDNSVYYFSFTTTATRQKKSSKYHKPDSFMSPHLWPTAILMGTYSEVIDSAWYENDGVVNSISMSHPIGSSHAMYSGVPKPGVWQNMEKLNWDHQSIVGHGVTKAQNQNIFTLYKKHCGLLYTLE